MIDAFLGAIKLILSGDKEFFEIVFLSIKISFISTSISTFISIPLAFFIAEHTFIGKRILIFVINTLMALPTVAIGLLVYLLLSRSGPLGFLSLLYTPSAIIIGEIILILPIMTGLLISSFSLIDKRVRKEAMAMGANRFQTLLILLNEGKSSIFSAINCGFGRVFAEIGIAMIVGGNIEGYTRTIPTAIALYTSKGDFVLPFALGIVLLFIAFLINPFFYLIKKVRL